MNKATVKNNHRSAVVTALVRIKSELLGTSFITPNMTVTTQKGVKR